MQKNLPNTEKCKYTWIDTDSYSLNHDANYKTSVQKFVPECECFKGWQIHKYLHSYNPIFLTEV